MPVSRRFVYFHYLVAALTALLPLKAAAQDVPTLDSPRWSYEIRVGQYEPDLPLFKVFYGDDTETYYSLGASMRLRDWLEAGVSYGQMRARGVGLRTGTEALGGSVRYRLNPLQLYANYIYQREPMQRVVPYAGAGLVVARYSQNIDIQGEIEGRADTGYALQLGVRFAIMSNLEEHERSAATDPLWRSFAFLELSDLSMNSNGTELGGSSLQLGFRMEFDMD